MNLQIKTKNCYRLPVVSTAHSSVQTVPGTWYQLPGGTHDCSSSSLAEDKVNYTGRCCRSLEGNLVD